jgi:hypothetical protein
VSEGLAHIYRKKADPVAAAKNTVEATTTYVSQHPYIRAISETRDLARLDILSFSQRRKRTEATTTEKGMIMVGSTEGRHLLTDVLAYALSTITEVNISGCPCGGHQGSPS